MESDASAALIQDLARHVALCRNVRLPGSYRPLNLNAATVGWVRPAIAQRLLELGTRAEAQAIVVENGSTLARAAAVLADEGLSDTRAEPFDIRESPDGPVLGEVDRGAIPTFGLMAWGVHVNGLVQRAGERHVWVARRARNKRLDPSKLDHVVAGGVPAGLTLEDTLIKEAGEEAGIPPELAARARRVATLSYMMDRPEGLRRDLIACYDLELPESFEPRAVDGEVEAFELWPLEAALERVARTTDFKFNVNLVLTDLFLRLGLVPDDQALRSSLYAPGW